MELFNKPKCTVLLTLSVWICVFLLQQSENTKAAVTSAVDSIKVGEREEKHSWFKFLNVFKLIAPASNFLFKQANNSNGTLEKNSWFQVSGHPNAFTPARPGTIWKKCSGGSEKAAYEAIISEPILRGITPNYLREVQNAGQTFIELEDLLYRFKDPNVMDIKMGTRTFLEDEVENTSVRKDLYRKMLAIDPNALTEEENKTKAVTKLSYLLFRDERSSTRSQGFRIDALKFRWSHPVTNFQQVKNSEDVLNVLSLFLGNREDVRQRLIERLSEIRTKLEQSNYLKQHQVVGSSILIIYDDTKVGAWLIDFAKSRPIPGGLTIDHRSPWIPCNHEEGFLFGLDQLILSLEKVQLSGGDNAVTLNTTVALQS